MLDIILIAIVWRRGWGAWALAPAACVVVLAFLAGATGLTAETKGSFVLVMVLIEYAILIAMAFNPRAKAIPFVSERTEEAL